MKKIFLVCFVFILLPYLGVKAQPRKMLDAAELQIAIQKLNVLGSVLYVAAHPDDENTAALVYFSKGRKYRTAYISLTRGDGGQNLIGPEKGAEIGIIRTQELMAARRFDKAEQFFTRAIDFGYSKTAEETFQFWGKEAILSDLVWVIRKFQPDIIVTRFPPDQYGGHGHHSASGLLAKEAFRAAADPNQFADQLKTVNPWQAKRFYWNKWRPTQEEIKDLQRIDVGAYDPLLGESYTEIAAKSRSMHKSQGFGATGRRGIRYDYFELLDGTPAEDDVFDMIDTSWKRVSGGQKTGQMVEDVIQTFDSRRPSGSLPRLMKLYTEMSQLEKTEWVRIKIEELRRIIQSCSGIWLEAITTNYAAAPGDMIPVKTTVINRSDHPIQLDRISYQGMARDTLLSVSLDNNEPLIIEKSIRIPEDHPISQPYWLKENPGKGLFSTEEQGLIGMAENSPSIFVKVRLTIDGNSIEYKAPLNFRWTDRVDGELYRQFEVRPRVTIHIENGVSIFSDNSPKQIKMTIKSHSPNAAGNIRLKTTGDWEVKPTVIPFSLTKKFEEKQVTFEVIPPEQADETFLTAEAQIGKTRIGRNLVEIAYPHIKRQTYFPESRIKIVKLDIRKLDCRIGYIMGAGDEVLDGLRNIGYDVIELNDDRLENEDLTQFDVLISGIRAYNTRERLKHGQPRLMQYVEQGGTLIVQYNVSRGLQTDRIGPYPFTIGRDRVSDELASVTFVDPDHQLLNFPNKITQDDLEGWVQERGLYFATQWDDRYQTILSSHDTGESAKVGGLLFTEYGEGFFMYTGYSWFRQLPAGVPGAFRFFVNLISAGKYDENITN